MASSRTAPTACTSWHSVVACPSRTFTFMATMQSSSSLHFSLLFRASRARSSSRPRNSARPAGSPIPGGDETPDAGAAYVACWSSLILR